MERKLFNFVSLFLVSSLFFITATPARALVADHTVISQFPSLTQVQINKATSYSTLFMTQSTGSSNVVPLGFRCLSGENGDPSYGAPPECTSYANNYPNGWPLYPYRWSWEMWPTPMSDGQAKTNQFVSIVHSRQQDFDVLGMKFCYVDAWNQDFNYYRTQMEQLQRDYPTKIFIWATQVLTADISQSCTDGQWFNGCDSIQSFNNQLRDYSRIHNIYLYDMADIESDGGRCYRNGKWGNDGTGASVAYEVLCPEYYDGYGSGAGGHPDYEGSIQLAKGFWWLMANISGSMPSITPNPTATPTHVVTPTPTPTIARKPGDANGDGRIDGIDYVIWLNHYGQQTTAGYAAGDFNSDGRVDGIDYVIWLNNFGT